MNEKGERKREYNSRKSGYNASADAARKSKDVGERRFVSKGEIKRNARSKGYVYYPVVYQ